MLKPIQSDKLSSNNVSHAFFTRQGGLSKGIYQGLNVGLGSDDDKSMIVKNRALTAAHLKVPETHLATPYQIHSPDVIIIDQPILGDKPKADAIVTKTCGLMIGILTADCGPVLFADKDAGVIAAAHAGWKGATSGILENTIAEMETLGAKKERIVAVLGPTISQDNYEVGPEFAENLNSLDKNNNTYLIRSANKGHFMFDLPQYIVDRLSKIEVQASWTGQCTYVETNQLFSYRRTTHNKEADYGRQLSAIKLA